VTLAGKELRVMWASPLPWVAGAALNATLGVLASAQIASRGQAVFQPVVPIAGFLLLAVCPVLAARCMSEESRTGTLELLLSIPVREWRLVTAKYVAVSTAGLVLLAPAGLFAVLLMAWGEPDPGPILTGLIGLSLMTLSLAAIGVLSSAMTASQPLAAAGGFFAVLALWFAHVGSEALPAGGLLASLSVSERLRSFAGGQLDLSDVAYFGSVTVVALAAAVLATRARRLR
jgi:ABC-2 type transport system permease protein